MQIKKIILGAATAILVGVILTGCGIILDTSAADTAEVDKVNAESVTLICGLTNKSVILPSDVQNFRDLALKAQSLPLKDATKTSNSINEFADSLARIQNVPLDDNQKSYVINFCSNAKKMLGK